MVERQGCFLGVRVGYHDATLLRNALICAVSETRECDPDLADWYGSFAALLTYQIRKLETQFDQE